MGIIYALGIWNLLVCLICYIVLRRKRALFDDRFAGTLAKTVPVAAALVLSIHLSVSLSLDLATIFMWNFLLGIGIGYLFGSFVKYHSVLIGIYHGLIGSAMGVMIGEVLKNPQLCSIPLTSTQEIVLNMIYLCGFATLLLTVILRSVIYSLRV